MKSATVFAVPLLGRMAGLVVVITQFAMPRPWLGLSIVYPATDEPWGVRRFFVADPNSVTINILSHRK